MKKSLIFLVSFCFVLCVICTACTETSPQNTTPASTTSGSQSTSESQSSTTEETSTEETTEQTTTESTSVTEETTEQATTTESSTAETTTQKKPYEVCYTKVRETKELATEIPELQEKIDRNDEKQYIPKLQEKVIVQIGDTRDVPYIFEMGGGQYFYDEYIIYPYYAGYPEFFKLNDNARYMPTYTYSGTETFVIEVNDKVYSTDKKDFLSVRYLDATEDAIVQFDSLEEMYENLPKGKYYVHFDLEVYGNYIFGENGNFIATESKFIVPAFMIELK